MKIHLYTLVWNEAAILPYTLRHYSRFCEKMVFFDNNSNDNSRDIIRSFPGTEIISFDTKEQLCDLEHMTIKNNAWKASSGQADWVIVCDCDELLYHEDLHTFLNSCQNNGYTIIDSIWCTMVSDSFPQMDGQITDNLRYQYGHANLPIFGKPIRPHKTALFSPNHIDEINYSAGAHVCDPRGRVKWLLGCVGLKNLHYKSLGFNYLRRRHKILAQRRSADNLKKGWGFHYDTPETELRTEFEDLLTHAVKLI